MQKSTPTSDTSADSLKVATLRNLKRKFEDDKTNKLIQNSLCSNFVYSIAEVRDYMQSLDDNFSHTIDPELEISNQGLSGRCWMFAVLNVMRHELIRKYKLTLDFELSESYICFYEKLEKCNYFLTQFMDKDTIDMQDRHTIELLRQGCKDGGYWITCANLIKKYGIIPKSCFRESINSTATRTMNNLINFKLMEFALEITQEKNKSKRLALKNKMIQEIYGMLCKMLGTPPNPNEKFNWSFVSFQHLTDQLEREEKRRRTGDKYENLQLKKTFNLTPFEFYNQFVVHNFDNYIKFANDPRNEYNKYYQDFFEELVIEGERNGYYNLPMDVISDLCIQSIKDNTPVQFDCDVSHYLNPDEELFDNKCYDLNLIFNQSFDKLTKAQQLNCNASVPNHAMVLVGVDIDSNGEIKKWKVENSWGRDINSTGYYTMSHEWFLKYVYNVVILKEYVPNEILQSYNIAKQQPITLPPFDVLL